MSTKYRTPSTMYFLTHTPDSGVLEYFTVQGKISQIATPALSRMDHVRKEWTFLEHKAQTHSILANFV